MLISCSFLIRCSNHCTSNRVNTVIQIILQNGNNMFMYILNLSVLLDPACLMGGLFIRLHLYTCSTVTDVCLRRDWTQVVKYDLFPVYPQPNVSVGYFRVSFWLCQKKSVQNNSFENVFPSIGSNSFSFERFYTMSRFQTEAQGNTWKWHIWTSTRCPKRISKRFYQSWALL